MEIREYRDHREEEILELYGSAGWSAYTRDPEKLMEGFRNSLLVLGAYEDDRLIGILRAVGDGATVVFVQDILVSPQHRRKGAGTALLKELLDRYQGVRQIELVTDDTPQTKAFYSSLGFRELSGTGMCGFIYAGTGGTEG